MNRQKLISNPYYSNKTSKLYSIYIEHILISTNLVFDDQMNEETRKFNWVETEHISHSDTGL